MRLKCGPAAEQRAALAGAVLWLCAFVNPPDAFATEMAATLRYVEYRGDKVFRLHLEAYETDTATEGDTRYPVTTLDRSLVSVALDSAPGVNPEIRSLTTVGAAPGETRRAVVVAFYPGVPAPARAASELRAALSDLLPRVPSAFLAIGAVDGNGVQLLGDSRPGQTENIVRFQHEILGLPVEGTGFSREAALCFAVQRFAAWDLSAFQPGDQKTLIIVGPDLTPRGKAAEPQSCGATLAAAGVRVFGVDWAPASAAPERRDPLVDAGFTHHLRSALDLPPALQNLAVNLNGEYLVDVAVPPVPSSAQPLRLHAVVRYHDRAVATGIWRMSTAIDDLNQPVPAAPAPATPGKTEAPPPPAETPWLLILVGALAVINGVIAAGVWTFRRLKTVGCNACGRRTAKNHADCPFRDRGAIARLVILDGPDAGRTLPLLLGTNVIGRAPNAQVRVRGRRIAWRRHGIVTLEGARALYTPRAPARWGPAAGYRDRVNGWPVSEPRLLGVGAVITVGERKLRFEVKPEALRD